ncbi:hypothetical protein [Plantibacter sp. CFBP 8804]|uniref:hypothetical protein n=1 Tax=Plantibacter sp. CFBP 8804 TaxID=2775270 RepID=UPI0017828835|nr:hypothetical protein [Plantibacter sp. CFBP 8804]MBD8519148.1 hypothetical protein [Plantibacter sp. CFBP 8804]
MHTRPEPDETGTAERSLQRSGAFPLRPSTPLEHTTTRRYQAEWDQTSAEMRRNGWRVERSTRSEFPLDGTYRLSVIWCRPQQGSTGHLAAVRNIRGA